MIVIRAHRLGLGALLVVVLASLAPMHAQSGASVRRVLEDTRSRDAWELQLELRALGPEAIPELFELAADPSVPLRSHERLAVVGALTRMPCGRVVSHLRTLVDTGADEDRRIRALHVLGEVGDAYDVALLTRLAPSHATRPFVERPVREAFALALNRLLARNPEALAALENAFPRVHPSLLAGTVRAIAARGDRAAVELLGRLLGRVEGADGLLLVEIGRLGPALGPPHTRSLLAATRECLERDDPLVVAQATGVAAGLDDEDAISTLIELLENRSAPVRQGAQGALVELTGLHLGAGAQEWRRWYLEEVAWWRAEAIHRLHELHGDPARASAAIRELAGHRLRREELAQALVPVLLRPEPQLVRLAAAALVSLRYDPAVEALVDCLDHRDAGVRKTAAAALRELTGRHLPDDPSVWRAALERRPG